ncbi:MAG: hypothetical protein ABFR97_04205 [Thermodesulfobacteriota bacterium]
MFCLLLCLLLTACAGRAQEQQPAVTPLGPLSLLEARGTDFSDGRARFRQIFCAVLAEHGQARPNYRACDEALAAGCPLPPADGPPVHLGPSRQNFLIGLVPGFAWQCVRAWMNNDLSGIKHVARYGYEAQLFEVDGLSSVKANGAQLAGHLAGKGERPVILIGYSKGVPDILAAVSQHPEVSRRVVAVVSVAGAVGGAPLASRVKPSQAKLLSLIPLSGCEVGDNGALPSLAPERRRKWLAANRLPADIRYYSVISYPDQDHISRGLKSSYRKLGGPQVANDGQIPIPDQLIPGSTLLAFVNADHWAMSVPVAHQMAFTRLTFGNKEGYPRDALLEAILRYVEEDLTGP